MKKLGTLNRMVLIGLILFAGWLPVALAVEAQTPPEAPTGLVLEVAVKGVTLRWIPSPQDREQVTAYEIGRAASAGGPYEVIRTVGKGSDHFLDTSAPPETILYYKVRAQSRAGASAWTPPVTGERPAAPGQ